MSQTRLVASRSAFLSVVLLFAACQPKSLEERVSVLPELPAELVETLDPVSLTTRAPVLDFTAPEWVVDAALCGCCSLEEIRRLQVTFPYTKCGSPADILAVDLSDFVATQRRRGGGAPDAGPGQYKLTALHGEALARPNICFSSNGPWDALLRLSRGCSPCTPFFSLTFSAFGDAVHFAWTGPQSPPANVQVVQCNSLGKFAAPCNGLSDCECQSSPCQQPAGCPCPLELPGSGSL